MINLHESVKRVVYSLVSTHDNEKVMKCFLDVCSTYLERKFYRVTDKELITKLIQIYNNDKLNDALIKIVEYRTKYPKSFVYFDDNNNLIRINYSGIGNFIEKNIDDFVLQLIIDERISQPFWKYYFESVVWVFESDKLEMYDIQNFNPFVHTNLFSMITLFVGKVAEKYTDFSKVYNFNADLAISLIMSDLDKYAKFWYSFAKYYVQGIK